MTDTYLITGGAGFIGSHLVHAVLNQGDNVKIIDNLSTGYFHNLEDVINDIEFIEGSILDQECLQKAMHNVDYVLHQAAIPSVPRSIEHPQESHEVNTTGTLNVLTAARDNQVTKVVYAASSSAYGDISMLPCREDTIPAPLSPYAVAKLTGEYYCTCFYQTYGLPTVALRYFNVFGPHQDATSFYSAVIPKFITLMAHGQQPTIYGDGLQSRDFTYIDNVVCANLLAAKASSNANGEVINIATAQPYTLLDIIAKINNILQTDIKPQFEQPQIGDIFHSYANIAKAEALINYQPTTSFTDGLYKTVQHYVNTVMVNEQT